MNLDLVITNGTLITASNTFRADIGIVGEKIAVIGQNLCGKRTIDATGKYVLPGAVDPHVHLEMPQGEHTSSDDFKSGTIAAACGGTTTIIDFVEPEENEPLLDALAARRAQADGHAVIDYGLHMTLPNASEATLAQIPAVIAAGVSTFKMYTIYGGVALEDDEMLRAFNTIQLSGGMPIVHAENRHIVKYLQEKFLSEGKTSPSFHPKSRPPIVEGEAIERVLALAEIAKSPVYIVHVSTALGAKAIQRAKERGQIAYGETCPQYLLLTDAEYDRPNFEGAKYICSPPLRPDDNPPALWNALKNGHLQSVGTDHCPFFFEGQKDRVRTNFTKIPGGMPGIESRLALLYTFGVMEKRISLNQWVDLCCTMPAKLFGIYPQKGTLTPRADADIIIFDPEKEITLSQDMLHEHVDYTPYEGLSLRGYPVTTIRRREVLCQDGEFMEKKTGGKFLARNINSGSL
ncbi:MAG: dihydropyrimidinase [Anaerolineae bacterium]|nr:dihydropyrimidinase [Anaerolineae bacterium]